ncbi:MAG: class I SAM-dependent methyltransferase [Phycisphaerae bacterium]|nr:class I SAM-dependent methyltransferase [Phycisphaerae bacterium]
MSDATATATMTARKSSRSRSSSRTRGTKESAARGPASDAESSAEPGGKPAARNKRRSRRRRSERKPRRGWRNASNSDPRELYELAVQSPELEATFIDRVFRKIRNRTPRTMREDFAASFALAGEWVRRRPRNTVVAIDLDPEVLAWGQRHRANERSAEELSRIRLVQSDVSRFRGPRVDVVAAFNFSYFVFKTPAQLRRYFENARRSLVRDGLFVIDAYGGYESWSVMDEERNLDGFTYVWDQAMVNPISNEVLNHIHFRFPDGSEIKRAFTYDWRLWTLAEIREALAAAGFRRSTVYWEGTERKTGGGNGVFRPSDRGEPCAGWIAYIVAER